MDTTSLYCFSSKPFQLKSLETKNVRSLFDFVAFYENNTISIEFETQNYTFRQTFLILSVVVEKRRKICYCFFRQTFRI
ncbi:hypothetical protein MHU86_9669 (mitochondrion) [Fragilaria crotonensis]|nr:hypothetical protein MHU86_9669 [Fragilaria crotonensis]